MSWCFADDYTRRILSPAVELFKSEGRLPDFFERYDLPVEVSNQADIENAIRTVTAFWNKTKGNSKFTEFLPVLIQQGSEAKRVLLDDHGGREALRAAVEAERRQRLEARFADVDRSLSVIAAKGYIEPSERALLVERFTRDGLAEADILARVRVPVREPARPAAMEPGLEKPIRDAIGANLATLGKRDLYDFLGLGPGASKEDIAVCYRKRDLERRVMAASHEKTAVDRLLANVKILLLDGDGTKYESARLWQVVERIRPDVKLAAADNRITRDEFKNLVALAISYGLDESRATDCILNIARDPAIGAAVEWAAGAEGLRCGNCLAVIPKTNALERCTICGAALWVDCPKCATRGPASDSACGKCGFRIADLPRLKLLIRKTQLALEDGRPDIARESAREAERLFGRHGDVEALLREVDARLQSCDEMRKRFDEAVAARRLFAARDNLAALLSSAPEYKFRDSKTPQDFARALQLLLDRVTAAVAKGHQAEAKKQFDTAALAYQEALSHACDADEASKGLSRCPIQPPANAGASLTAGHVVVQWAPSPAVGSIEYVVVRRDGRPPTSISDGDVVARTRNTSCHDVAAKAGAFVFYSAFAERGAATSTAAQTSGVLVSSEVTDLAVEAGDAVVSASWTVNARNARVRVYRGEDQAPAHGAQGTEILLAGPQRFVDKDVRNGRLYYYRICIEYPKPNGQPVLTPGLVVSARPEQPPALIKALSIVTKPTGLFLSWEPPLRGTVSIYRLAQPSSWEIGTNVAAARLTELGTALRVTGSTTAVDPTPARGLAYYLPVTVAGDIAVIGCSRRYAAIPDVTEIDAQDFGLYLQLRWQWPPNSSSALVAWRSDAYPQSADDPNAAKRALTRGGYDAEGGFRLQNPEARPYRFVVYSVLQLDDSLVYSSGINADARAEFRTRPPVDVRYSLKRGWLRRDRFTLTISATEPVEALPDVIMVAKRGDLQPLGPGDGTVVTRFDGLSIAARSAASLDFQLNAIRPPVYLRLFFCDPTAYQRFRLGDPPPDQLKVA